MATLVSHGFRAAIFDLDGVLADSAVLHYAAWRRLADELGIPFDAAANEALKGVDRAGSLRLLLRLGNRDVDAATFTALCERKDGYYRELLATVTPASLLPGAAALIDGARQAGLKLAVASASRNAIALLDRLGIAKYFNYIADAAAIAHPKPAPDIFLACAAALSIAPGDCIGFEDAVVGVEAIVAAGMAAVGIGDAVTLGQAHLVFPTTAAVDLARVLVLHRLGFA